jgi:hypothetical protein
VRPSASCPAARSGKAKAETDTAITSAGAASLSAVGKLIAAALWEDKGAVMRMWFAGLVAVALLFAFTVATSADLEECREALNQLQSTKSDLADALRSYASCLQDTDGHDDCSSEFSTLKSAKDDFESAVSVGLIATLQRLPNELE